MMRALLAPALTAVVAACAAPASPPVAFQCGGERIEVRLANGTLALHLDGARHELQQVEAASGARYQAGDGDGRTLFWDKGDAAHLEIGGRTYPECRRLRPATAETLHGEWVVEDIAGRGIVDASRATLSFDTYGRLSGHATCNAYTGTWNLAGDTLRIGPLLTTERIGRLAATRRACPQALMIQEVAFVIFLRDVARAEMTADGGLVVTTAGGVSITARR